MAEDEGFRVSPTLLERMRKVFFPSQDEILKRQSDFLGIDARRRSGVPGLASEDREKEGALIASMLPPGIGPAAAGAAGLGYEYLVKPMIQYSGVARDLAQGTPLEYKPGITSPAFEGSNDRLLALIRGAIKQNIGEE